mmetsp:Transcript_197/g.740  ORF Transcript_197/g.740 Transcript_197/m.740 type:complete len:227 (+) Transcript_197:285-965(+)
MGLRCDTPFSVLRDVEPSCVPWPRRSDFGFALMSPHFGMWRSPAAWLKRRWQFGHWTYDGSTLAAAAGRTGSGLPWAVAAVSSRMLRMASRRASDCCCHFFCGSPGAAGAAAETLRALASFFTSKTPFLNRLRSSPSKPFARTAAALNSLRCFFGAHFGQHRMPSLASKRSRTLQATSRPHVTHSPTSPTSMASSGKPEVPNSACDAGVFDARAGAALKAPSSSSS